MELQSQQKSLDLQRGLFLIKYEGCDDSHHPPSVQVSPDQGSESSIELILSPDADRATLWSPGASLVARASRNARLRLVVTATQPNGSTAARVQVVSLSQDPAGARQRAPSAPLDLSGFRVLGHVAGLGDVAVDAENWIAGPLAPSRIEGLAIQWPNKPPDLGLRYAVTLGGARPTMGPITDVGNFAGTRGRALPLVGATLELSGGSALGQQLVVDSIFLGAPQLRTTGQRVVLTGPTGREPLVGLRVRIDPIDQAARTLGPVPVARPAEDYVPNVPVPEAAAKTAVAADDGKNEDIASPAPKRSSGRVRVFRSQGRRNVSASAAAT
jgi:hypothetical protein